MPGASRQFPKNTLSIWSLFIEGAKYIYCMKYDLNMKVTMMKIYEVQRQVKHTGDVFNNFTTRKRIWVKFKISRAKILLTNMYIRRTA